VSSNGQVLRERVPAFRPAAQARPTRPRTGQRCRGFRAVRAAPGMLL